MYIVLFHGLSQYPRRNSIILNEPLEFRKEQRTLICINMSMISTILSPYNVHLSGWWGQVGFHLKIALPLLSYCPVGAQGWKIQGWNSRKWQWRTRCAVHMWVTKLSDTWWLAWTFPTWIIRTHSGLQFITLVISIFGLPSLTCHEVYERDLLWSLKPIPYHEKLGPCARSRLNPGCLMNKSLIWMSIGDLFLASPQIHLKMVIAAMWMFLGFREIVPDRMMVQDWLPWFYSLLWFCFCLIPRFSLFFLSLSSPTYRSKETILSRLTYSV